MSTTSDRLALLQRTKAGQRSLLEEMYPDLDFSTIPFREYGRLFTGRKYVPGFVGGWKCYGRSNSEDASTRDILPDYSGNGRDIRLYNFGFAGMSGYGGYAQENYSFVANLNNIYSVQSVGTKVVVNRIESSIIPAQSKVLNKNISTGWNLGVVNKIKAGDYGIVIWKTKSGGAEAEILCELAPGDTGTFVNEQTDIDAGLIYIMAGPQIAVPAGQSFSFEFLPTYPGALVSDGIDDYGQCVKGFALPDDYTVVAIRRIIEGHDGGFVSKGSTGGAFIFDSTRENIYSACWSYGVKSTGTPMPSLFSYQMKGSYNGQEISYGTAEDTAEDQLTVFRHGTQLYCQGVLYDLRIYDHSLTAEELQIVRDEMMSDYENATGGGIADIHYVADWDGKGRSNDEEEPMRSTWTDKATGKVINLSNFSFSEMSGWNGYAFDFTDWHSDQEAKPLQISKSSIKAVISGFENYQYNGFNFYVDEKNSTKRVVLRITGLPKENAKAELMYRPFDGTTEYITLTSITSDGILTADVPDSSITLVYVTLNRQIVSGITIEQLPLYPGALVSDGIDDCIRAEEALGTVGTVLIHWKNIGLKISHYLYNTGWEEDAGRLYCWNTQGNIACGTPHMQMDGHPIMIYHRSPLVSTVPLNSNENNCPIFRLIFIKEQLDEYQQEFLEWKVGKEYRDWCKKNGYEYAISEMLNN